MPLSTLPPVEHSICGYHIDAARIDRKIRFRQQVDLVFAFVRHARIVGLEWRGFSERAVGDDNEGNEEHQPPRSMSHEGGCRKCVTISRVFSLFGAVTNPPFYSVFTNEHHTCIRVR